MFDEKPKKKSFFAKQFKEMLGEEMGFLKETKKANAERARELKKQRREAEQRYMKYREQAYQKEYERLLKAKARKEGRMLVRQRFGSEKNAVQGR